MAKWAEQTTQERAAPAGAAPPAGGPKATQQHEVADPDATICRSQREWTTTAVSPRASVTTTCGFKAAVASSSQPGTNSGSRRGGLAS